MEITKTKPVRKVLLSRNKLFLEINQVIKDRGRDIKLRKRLNDKFLKKGLDGNTVSALFSHTMELQQLEIEDINKLICLTKSMYEELDKLEKYRLNTSDYFSDMELLAYDLYRPEKEELLKSIELENVIRINDYEYLCYLSAEYLSKLRKSGLLKYRFDIQRPARIKKGKNGEISEQMSINKENVIQLKNRFKGLKESGEKETNPSHDIITSQIYFCVLLEDGKTPLFKWTGNKEKLGSVGSLSFTPVFDKESENYAPFIIPDGYHRDLALCDAYDEEIQKGIKIEKGFSVLIYLGDKEKAITHVGDTFKRADINTFEKKKIEKSDVVEATDKLINGIKIFNEDNIAPDYEYFNIYGGKYITYRTLLIDSMKETGDKFDNWFASDRKVNKMAKFINTLFSYFDSENISKDSLLYSAGMFVGYIALANELVDSNIKESDMEVIDYIGTELIELENSNELKDMKLNNKNLKIKQVFKFFEKMAMEVEQLEGEE